MLSPTAQKGPLAPALLPSRPHRRTPRSPHREGRADLPRPQLRPARSARRPGPPSPQQGRGPRPAPQPPRALLGAAPALASGSCGAPRAAARSLPLPARPENSRPRLVPRPDRGLTSPGHRRRCWCCRGQRASFPTPPSWRHWARKCLRRRARRAAPREMECARPPEPLSERGRAYARTTIPTVPRAAARPRRSLGCVVLCACGGVGPGAARHSRGAQSSTTAVGRLLIATPCADGSHEAVGGASPLSPGLHRGPAMRAAAGGRPGPGLRSGSLAVLALRV